MGSKSATNTPTKHGDASISQRHVPGTPATPATNGGHTPQRYALRTRSRKDSPGASPSRRSSTTARRAPVSFSTDHVSGADREDTSRTVATMASSAGKWREEQILTICPGSRTTMAQLGCNELTPPMHRFPTRMFRDGDEWRPYHTFKRTKVVGGAEVDEWVEDVDSDEGAVYPIQGGRIARMDAFLAFLDHVHAMLTTTFHNTPIMLMASPQWTRPDCEAIAQYIFEKTRTPALCIIHSGIATQYGLKWPNMTVVDIGYEKVDVTAIHDGRVVNHMDLGALGADRLISGGEAFTQALFARLRDKGWTHDMAEQLKKSTICEVLPYAAGQENLMELPKEVTAGVPPTGAVSPEAPRHVEPVLTEEGENGGEPIADDEGVLDVAAIVTSGQTKEFLAKKEKEKEKGKGGRKPKDKEAEAGAARARLPNSKRTHNTFFYEEIIQEEVPPEPKEAPKEAPKENGANGSVEAAPKEGEANGTVPPVDGAATEEAPKPMEPTGDAPAPDTVPAPAPAPAEAESRSEAQPMPEAHPETTNGTETPERRAKRVRRDVEVGLERFSVADREQIDRIVSTIYRTIQGIDDMYMRPACWDNLVFVGNGARLRGLRDNILQTLHARHLVSPSTATMFTSELPSNMATPTGTGSQTPTGSFTGAPHQLSSSGVNPLLQAATTASMAAVATPAAGSDAGGPVAHHFHSQTPTSIKTAGLPTYLGEWTKNGFEEAMFLGALVAARIAFCLHSNMDAQSVEAQRLMSLSRVDYNELGPKGIRTHSMLS